jgi:hypothetical protein
MKTTKFPQFDSYACEGDSITWQSEGYDLTARLERDGDCSPLDFDCYSPIKIKQWKNDKWFYVGVVISVSFNGVELSDHASSLWGIDCNYNRTSNKYLAEVAREMESEALEVAKQARETMLSKLGATA